MKLRRVYENPCIDITQISTVDIITTSTPEADNPPKGEWDTDL